MRIDLRERLGKEWLFFDGGMGTLLQEKGLKGGELPERWNLTHPEIIRDLHIRYLEAGADIFNANTFGLNSLKFPGEVQTLAEAAINNAKEAREKANRPDAYIAIDIGPTGKLLEPLGDLSFDRAVELFAEVIRAGAAAGGDLVLIETMSDTYEAKAAVLAAKENTDLPVIVTCVFDEKGKMLTGGTVDSAVAMLEGLGVDALGINCSLGPEQMFPLAKRMAWRASVPVVINPNAGLPRNEGGRTVYDVGPEEFAEAMGKIAGLGVQALGGCCGTTPEHIRRMIETVLDKRFRPNTPKYFTVVSSFSTAVTAGRKPVIVGERINPTGKKRFKQALRDNDIDYILSQGLEQEDAGAQILDVNVGLPEIDEPRLMREVVTKLQGVTGLPLQLDTTNIEALEAGLRYYNGKAMVNSVNGKDEVIDQVMPLVKKYGGVLVGLTLDENGIPNTADGRIAIAEKIYRAADSYGIPRKDIVIDGLCLTASSDTSAAGTTLETVRRIRENYHGHTILGVSNISFGLPQRQLINASFLTMALQSGLSFAIMNPNSQQMMAAFHAYLALADLDPRCEGFIAACADMQVTVTAGTPASSTSGSGELAAGDSGAGKSKTDMSSGALEGKSGIPGSSSSMTLGQAIVKGLAGPAGTLMKEALAQRDPLEIVNSELIPALDKVGQGFEKGTVFLPQLLMSAEAAKAAFEVAKAAMAGKPREQKGKVIVATVKGDIHDIGKNIVKVMLENYGYDVLDLGKDVPPETVVARAVEENVPLVGLSALMTTTVVSMEETIRLLRETKPEIKVVVGGAVMTQEYADRIGADYYAKDAMATVRCADEVFGNGD